VRPPRLFRTTSFRLTLIYATVFTASVVVLFAIIYWSSAGFMARQMDVSINAELAALLDGQPDKGLEHLRREVEERIRQAPPGLYYLLQSRTGEVLASNLPRRAPAPHIVDTPTPVLFEDGTGPHGFRGRGVVTTDQAYLFVANDNFQLEEMQELVARAFGLALVLTLVLALGGGALMSAGLLRRVEAVSRTSREIVEGNLDRRMPVAGTDDEFDHLAASLNTMLDRIQGLMAGLRQVSDDIAHDLRTPLTRLRQRLELARRREASVEGLESALDGAIQQVDGILDTFGALLRIAQIEGGSRRGTFKETDLSELVLALVETYQPVAEEKEQRLESAVAEDLRVRGDRELLVQMLANLIENAIRHSPERATIRVAARCANGRPEIVVADDGPGIPAIFRDRVFQRFFRLEDSRTTPRPGLVVTLRF